MLELPKVRFIITLLSVFIFGLSYVRKEYAYLQYAFFTLFFLINTYVLVHSFFDTFFENRELQYIKKLDCLTLMIIALLDIFSVYTGHGSWVLAYTGVIVLCLVVVPFVYYYFRSNKRSKGSE